MSANSLRTVIADDESIARNRLNLLCAELGGIDVVGLAEDGVDALRQIEELSPDLVLLDIAMPTLDGMGVAQTLGRKQSPPAIIFCTAYDRHALAAFDVSAVDYLLKPISRDRLARAIEKTRNHIRTRTALLPAQAWLDHLWVPHRGAMVRIDIASIHRIYAERDYVQLMTTDARYLLHETMAAIEDRLNPTIFVRLRRSVIVRVTDIMSVRHEGLGIWSALLTDHVEVRIGPTYLKKVRHRLSA